MYYGYTIMNQLCNTYMFISQLVPRFQRQKKTT